MKKFIKNYYLSKLMRKYFEVSKQIEDLPIQGLSVPVYLKIHSAFVQVRMDLYKKILKLI
jgi:hypothetical protein